MQHRDRGEVLTEFLPCSFSIDRFPAGIYTGKKHINTLGK
jgi:hypothetical protein